MARELRVWYIFYTKSMFLKQDTCKMTVHSEAHFYCALPYCKKYTYNVSVNNTIYLYTTKIVYCQSGMFRPLLGHPQAH
jgi:hypothetical protein